MQEAILCRVYVTASCATDWMQMRMLIRAIQHGRTAAHIGTILASNCHHINYCSFLDLRHN